MNNPGHENKSAEFFTPQSLRADMINKIPDNFFKTPKHVLEPSCGNGGFVYDVVYMFYNNLDRRFQTNEQRWKWIVENCIWFVDVLQKNIDATKQLLGDYDLNYYVGDTLKMDLHGFDLVIANPPFNYPIRKSGNTLWQFFVKHALNKWLVNNGYFVCVHPPGWRKPVVNGKERNTGMFQLMCHDNTMLCLNINDTKEGERVFNAGTQFDWYVIQKHPNADVDTHINNCYNQEYYDDLKLWSWYPNGQVDFIKDILYSNHYQMHQQ